MFLFAIALIKRAIALIKEWFGVVKKLYFVKPGYYRIDVLKADKSQISSTFITISDR